MATNITFAELLSSVGVVETTVLKSPRLGFMAYHGGELEKVTDIIAFEAAERSGCSYYAVTQSLDPIHHITSADIDRGASDELCSFIEHVDAVITIHGYGRNTMWRTLLLGGRNRELASHVASHLGPALPDYDIVDDVDAIPKKLRGQHERNPVNIPRQHGLQIELPPTIRWNGEASDWSDFGEAKRAPDTETLIESLARAATEWIAGPNI